MKAIKTLDDIKRRCIEVGECWEWQGAVSAEGVPYIWSGGRAHTVRRLAVMFHSGRAEIPSGHVSSMRCGNRLCVRPHPEHIVLCTTKQHRAYLTSQGIGKGCTARKARADGLTAQQIVEKYGCTRANAYALLAGHIWREQLPGASVFSLGAA